MFHLHLRLEDGGRIMTVYDSMGRKFRYRYSYLLLSNEDMFILLTLRF